MTTGRLVDENLPALQIAPPIFTSEIAPCDALTPYVRSYALREFDTHGVDLVKPWHASAEMGLHFFFKAKPVQLVCVDSDLIVNGESYGVMGMSTVYNGKMTFNGCYSFFIISFKPSGFQKLFRIQPQEINNKIISADDIFDATLKILYERLALAATLSDMAKLSDDFLLGQMQKQRSFDQDRITTISNAILSVAGRISVDQLAYNANMSIRNFERCFIEQVGIPPKLFCSITRFNYAFEMKLRYPEKDWTSIALDSGYFDQMHLIKAFKKFSGSPPSLFLKKTPLTQENYSSRVEL